APEDFFEKIRVQGRGEPLLGDTLLGRVRLQERERQAAEQGQVLRGIPLADPVVIFGKGHIQLPMEGVLNPPMIPQGLALDLGRRSLAADEIAQFLRCPPVDRALAIAEADGGETGPVLAMTQASGMPQERVAAVLVPAVAPLARLVGVVVQAGEVVLAGLY